MGLEILKREDVETDTDRVKSGLMQLGDELEEVSRVVGASWWVTYRRIVLRLMAPTLMAVGMITFVGAARNIGNIALLATSANRPLSILQLEEPRRGCARADRNSGD